MEGVGEKAAKMHLIAWVRFEIMTDGFETLAHFQADTRGTGGVLKSCVLACFPTSPSPSPSPSRARARYLRARLRAVAGNTLDAVAGQRL